MHNYKYAWVVRICMQGAYKNYNLLMLAIMSKDYLTYQLSKKNVTIGNLMAVSSVKEINFLTARWIARAKV